MENTTKQPTTIKENMENLKEIEATEIVSERNDHSPNHPGFLRIQRDWSDVPSMADQSQRDENNINVLMEKYKPDELAQYLAQRNINRMEITDHDFSQEPNLQNAMNSAYEIKELFNSLDEEIKYRFRGKPAEFLKFCSNPQNQAQLEKWGLHNLKEPVKPKIDEVEKTAKPVQSTEPVPKT